MAKKAANWFHAQWDIPFAAYYESIHESIANPNTIPQWYLVIDLEGEIIGGCGVIENDFHARKDLAPNLCALYVDPAYRGQKIASKLLSFVRKDVCSRGFNTLYLLTDHTNFYEKCGWEFLCLIACDNGSECRVYTAKT